MSAALMRPEGPSPEAGFGQALAGGPWQGESWKFALSISQGTLILPFCSLSLWQRAVRPCCTRAHSLLGCVRHVRWESLCTFIYAHPPIPHVVLCAVLLPNRAGKHGFQAPRATQSLGCQNWTRGCFTYTSDFFLPQRHKRASWRDLHFLARG